MKEQSAAVTASSRAVSTASSAAVSTASPVAPAAFAEGERRFAEMIDNGGILVEDRWFAKDSTELERAKYRLSYHVREERNRRRRERRRELRGPAKPRNVRGYIAIDDGSQRANRLTLERRKCLRRATVSRCPLPNEVRTAWRFRNETPETKLRLGGLLLDLECYVDNSLVVKGVGGHPQIVARSGGIRGWIRENCPELGGHYKTLMRFKALAKNIRQAFGIPDPVPTAFLLDPDLPPESLADRPLQVQPRREGDEESAPGDPAGGGSSVTAGLVTDRFVWERSRIDVDATGRPFRLEENYWLVAHTPDYCRTASGHLRSVREAVRDIVLNGKANRTIENYSRGPGALPSRPSLRVLLGAGGDGATGGCGGRNAVLAGIEAERRRKAEGRAGLKGVGMAVLDGLAWYCQIPYRMTHEHRHTMKELENEW